MRRREAARTAIAGSAAWSLLMLADDLAATPGSAVDTAPVRVGADLTAAGAARPAASGGAYAFAGTQRLATATGLLGGATGATVVYVGEATSTTGTVYAYGTPYYDGRRAYLGISGTAYSIVAGNGESALGNRNNIFAPVGTGTRAVAATFDRTQAAASELMVYDSGELSAPTASVANDTTGTYQATQAGSIGAYSNGTVGVTMDLRAIGVIAATATAGEVRRLSRLLAAACGV